MTKETLIKHIEETLKNYKINWLDHESQFWNGYLSYALEIALEELKGNNND